MSGWRITAVFNIIGARKLQDYGWAASIDAAVDEATLNFSGWVLAADQTITGVTAWQEGPLAETPLNHDSLDVASNYLEHPGAVRCRFMLSVPLTEKVGTLQVVTLHATTASGDRMHIATIICRRQEAFAPRVFVVGSPRSGTTAVGNAIRHAMKLPNYGESHVLPVLQGMIEDIDRRLAEPNTQEASRQLANMMAHLPGEELRERLGENFRAMYRQLNRGEIFCDKTPGVAMLRAIPAAMWLWPDARFIFCKRRGLDNVASRMRKFSQDDFAGHCHDWTMAMKVWLEMAPCIPAAQRREVDQFDLLRDADGLGKDIGSWVGLDAAGSDAVAQYLATQHPERTQEGSASQSASLSAMGWDESLVAQFREICGPMMAHYGYTENGQYRVPANP